jgi:endonuclease/exonuclease/phosphatase family metal-dependent hydrolase
MVFHSAVGAGGLAMLSRFPLAEESIFESPNQSDPDWHPAWSVTVDTGPSGMIRILGLHLRAILSGRSSDSEAYFNVEEDHALEIRTFAASFDTTLSPSLVVGDFNEEPGGPAVRYLENAGYRSALPLFHPGQGTWSAPSLGGQLSKTLDHVFFDASFAPLNAQVVKGGNSDHIPVVARLEFVDPVF